MGTTSLRLFMELKKIIGDASTEFIYKKPSLVTLLINDHHIQDDIQPTTRTTIN